jgi:hypothetical protein
MCVVQDQYPPDETDVIHVEDGSWSGANNGDPLFNKWEQNFFDPKYEPNRNSWATMVGRSVCCVVVCALL